MWTITVAKKKIIILSYTQGFGAAVEVARLLRQVVVRQR